MNKKGRNVGLKLFLSTFTERFVLVSMAMLLVVVAVRLGNLQTEGLLASAVGGLALAFAFTSLLFNRARAYQEGKTQRRTLRAAELSFRGTIALGATVVYGAVVLLILIDLGYKPSPAWQMPTQFVPMLASMPAILVLIYVYSKFSQAVRITMHGVFAVINTRRFLRSVKRRSA